MRETLPLPVIVARTRAGTAGKVLGLSSQDSRTSADTAIDG